MSSTVHESLRIRLERMIHSDTGAGGLMNTSSVAFLRGVYYAVPPSTEAGPHVVYNFTTRPGGFSANDGTAVDAVTIELVIATRARKVQVPVDPTTYSSGAVHDWGFGKSDQDGRIAAVIARMRQVVEVQANWGSETAGAQTWFFAGPTLQSIEPGGEKDADFVELRLRYTLAAVQSSSAANLPTGLGFGFAVALYNPINGATSAIMTQYGVFAYSIQSENALVPVTRMLDLEERLTTAIRRQVVALRWYPSPNVTTFNTIPEYNALKLTRSPGQTFRLTLSLVSGRALTFYGLPTISDVGNDKNNGRVVGRLIFRSSAPRVAGDFAANPPYGPNIFVEA